MSDQKWIVFCVFNSIVVALITGLVMANMVLPNQQKQFDRIEAEEFILKGTDGRTYARLGLEQIPEEQLISEHFKKQGFKSKKSFPQLLSLKAYSHLPMSPPDTTFKFYPYYVEISHTKNVSEHTTIGTTGLTVEDKKENASIYAQGISVEDETSHSFLTPEGPLP